MLVMTRLTMMVMMMMALMINSSVMVNRGSHLTEDPASSSNTRHAMAKHLQLSWASFRVVVCLK